jgi:two-component system NtrC family sensor kinase
MSFQPSLITKLTLSTTIVLLISMGLLDYFNLATFRKVMYDYAVSDADSLSQIIIETTYNQKMEHDQFKLTQLINWLGGGQGIEHIRLINKNGRIIFSSKEEEIGTFVNKDAEACSMCHEGMEPKLTASSMHRSRIFRNPEGKEVLGLARAIYNREGCYVAACHFHPENFKVLGVLDIIVSLDSLNHQISLYRYRFVAMTCILIFMIWMVLNLLTQKLVNRPIQQLVHHTRQIASGDLESKPTITSRDEFGKLAGSFASMTESLRTAQDDLKSWGMNLESIVEERTREIKQIQAQLIRSEKLASLGELVAGIAHEINNPLTGILVFSSLVTSDKRLDPALQEDMEMVVRETKRCAEIVKGLLEFSREYPPQTEQTSLNDIMDKALSLVCHQSSFHSLTLEKEYQADLPLCTADPNQVEQVFINILLNASQAMPGGGILHVRTAVSDDRSSAFVEISDTGCGIPEETLARIFDPFYTTKSKGTGLGLSVSYGIIENHGGRIEVRSQVGAGTTFTIFLPLVDQARHIEEKGAGHPETGEG